MTDAETLQSKEAASADPHGSEALPLPHWWFSRSVDKGIDLIGRGISYMWVALVAVILYNVFTRYFLGEGSILLEEVQWAMYGIGLMVGMSYAITADRHVRVDVLADRFPVKVRMVIEVIGLTVLLLPFAVICTYESLEYVQTAFRLHEVSIAPDGLSYWQMGESKVSQIALVKAFLTIGFGLMALAAFSRLTRVIAWFAGKRPAHAEDLPGDTHHPDQHHPEDASPMG
ncbi:MAG: TRAP transporter small permease subunit [Alphaproteobacteria bacterium]